MADASAATPREEQARKDVAEAQERLKAAMARVEKIKEEDKAMADEKADEESKAAAIEAKVKEHEELQRKEQLEKWGEVITVEKVQNKIEATAASEMVSGFNYEDAVEKLTSFYKARMWSDALEIAVRMISYINSLAPDEKKKYLGGGFDLLSDVAVLTHNLAAILHQLGCYQAAVYFYKDAQAKVSAVPEPNLMVRCLEPFMGAQKKKVAATEFLAEQLTLALEGKKPPPGQHLDEDNNKGMWQDTELEKNIEAAKAAAKQDVNEDAKQDDAKEEPKAEVAK